MTTTAQLEVEVDSRGVEKAAKNLNDLAGSYRDLSGRLRDSSGKFIKEGEAVKGLTGQYQKLTNQLKKLALAYFGLNQAKSVINTFADFGRTMAFVRTTTGATGAEFEKLNDLAKRLGATTAFSATQAAQAILELSRQGKTVNEVLTSTGPIIDFAIAGNLSLAEAAQIAGSTLNQFGLDISEVGRVTDTLVQVANNSSTTVAQLGQAMKQAGTLSRFFGSDVEEAVAAVGAMSEAAIQGGEAGTGLKGLFGGLAGPTGEAKKLLEDIATRAGVAVKDLDLANNSIIDIFKTLKKGRAGPKELIKIFGRDQIASALALTSQLDKADEILGKLGKNAKGAAKNVSEAVSATLSGKIADLASAFESLQIKIGELVGGPLIAFIEGLTILLRQLSGAAIDMDKFSTSGKVVATVLGLAVKALIAYVAWSVIARLRTLALAFSFAKLRTAAATLGTSLRNLSKGSIAVLLVGAFELGRVLGDLIFKTDELSGQTLAQSIINKAHIGLLTVEVGIRKIILANTKRQVAAQKQANKQIQREIDLLKGILKTRKDLNRNVLISQGLAEGRITKENIPILKAVLEAEKKIFKLRGVSNLPRSQISPKILAEADREGKIVARALFEIRSNNKIADDAATRSERARARAAEARQRRLEAHLDLINKFVDLESRALQVVEQSDLALASNELQELFKVANNLEKKPIEEWGKAFQKAFFEQTKNVGDIFREIDINDRVNSLTKGVADSALTVGKALAESGMLMDRFGRSVEQNIRADTFIQFGQAFREQIALTAAQIERQQNKLNTAFASGESRAEIERIQQAIESLGVKGKAALITLQTQVGRIADNKIVAKLNTDLSKTENQLRMLTREANKDADAWEEIGEVAKSALLIINKLLAIPGQNQKELIADQKRFNNILERTKENSGIVAREFEDMNRTFKEIATQIGDSLGNAFVEFITGARNASDAVKDLLKQVIKLTLQTFIQKAISSGVSGIFPSADGNAFSGGQVMPFANGGIISSPTIFPLGLAGEAGPEAILPLQRGSNGKLGVMVTGGGSGGSRPVTDLQNRSGSVTNYSVTIKTADPSEFGASSRQIQDTLLRATRR